MSWNDYIKDRYSVEDTFEELCDRLGIDKVFEGTDVDAATQQALLDFFFDFEICDSENKFLRRFRQRLNQYYDQYLQEVRVLSVRDNFDPYVTNYFQDVKKHSGTKDTVGNIEYNNKRTDDYTTSSSSQNVETHNLKTNTDTSDNTNTTESGKNKQYNVSYPEANMSETADIDTLPSLNYISSEVDGLNKGESNTSSNGETNTSETGDITNSGSDSSTSKTTSGKSGNDKSTENETDNYTDTWERKGRDTSVASLVSAAVKAVENTNALNFLIKKVMPCFNTTSII